MNKITLLFGIHNHQPVGNFDDVFSRIFKCCYKPFLKILAKYPFFRISLHFTGPLYEWIDKNEPEIKELIRELVTKKQVELLGGGFYEPILSSIPENDATGQIKMMNDYIMDNFSYEVKGIWLAERVWEPLLPKLLNSCNIKYTLLDDTHFYYAGLRMEDMHGYYVTEQEGKKISIFPIDKNLRYSIPFVKADKIISYLKDLSVKFPNSSITYGDDGEKFGEWPGTEEWVYKNGWLDDFCSMLSQNGDWIKMQTFSEYLCQNPATGRIYLPTSSYEEMGEWVLSPETHNDLEEFIQHLKQNNIHDKYKQFVRGGIWSNFISKYDEINNMHKKMLHVSNKINSVGINYTREANNEAIKNLYQGQCNCAYWHGLFGGFYLPHLRGSIYKNLLKAEACISQREDQKYRDAKITIEDIDCDNNEEVIIENDTLNCYVKPDQGGSLFELDLVRSNFNLLNTLKRRKESYHKKLFELKDNIGTKDNSDTIKTIHDLVIAKEDNLDEKIFYDWHNRYSYLDHFVDDKCTFEGFKMSKYVDLGDFVLQRYELIHIDTIKDEAKIFLKRDGTLLTDNKKIIFSVLKQYKLKENLLTVSYNFSDERDAESNLGMPQDVPQIINAKNEYHGDKGPNTNNLYFALEFNFNPECENSPNRYFRLNDKVIQFGNDISEKNVNKIDIICKDLNFSIELASCIPFELWSYPVRAVSQSESGFELTFQGTSLLFKWNFCSIRKGVELSLKYFTL